MFSDRHYDTNTRMWNKIYFIALAIALLIVTILSFYSYNWLTSVDAPINVVQNYEFFSGITWMFLWLSSIILLVIATVMFWRLQQSWGLWATFLYFAFFIIIQTFLLDDAFVTFKNRNNLGESNLFVTPFLGVILCVLGAIIVFFDQYLISRLHKKMYGIAPEAVKMEGDAAEL